MGAPVDILLVSLGSTGGWRAADAELAGSLRRAGASVAVVAASRPREVRTLMATDLLWAAAARRAALRGLAEHSPRAVVYSTTTAALLWPRPGAIRFDSPASANRPGRHGVWQRPLERRRLVEAPLLVPTADGSLAELGRAGHVWHAPAVVVPVSVEPSGPPAPTRDVAAVMYAANPEKKGLAIVLEAWSRARRPGEELVIGGLDALPPGTPFEGVRCTGPQSRTAYRALLRRARVFVTAPRREDYGIAQLEALVDGCRLVTTPAGGPYPALALARTLDPRLVSRDLARALRTALDDPSPGYAERAAQAIAPFRRAPVDRVVAAELLPRLLGGYKNLSQNARRARRPGRQFETGS